MSNKKGSKLANYFLCGMGALVILVSAWASYSHNEKMKDPVYAKEWNEKVAAKAKAKKEEEAAENENKAIRYAAYRYKDIIESTLKDKDSAEYRGVFITKDKVLCGQINAKNSFDGYVGYRDFIASPEVGFIIRPNFAMWNIHCSGAATIGRQKMHF